MTDAVLLSGPIDMEFYGRDATAWKWFMNGHEITVEISNTAMEAHEEGDGGRLAQAIKTQGQSEVERMADWDVPNPTVVLSTANRYD